MKLLFYIIFAYLFSPHTLACNINLGGNYQYNTPSDNRLWPKTINQYMDDNGIMNYLEGDEWYKINEELNKWSVEHLLFKDISTCEGNRIFLNRKLFINNDNPYEPKQVNTKASITLTSVGKIIIQKHHVGYFKNGSIAKFSERFNCSKN